MRARFAKVAALGAAVPAAGAVLLPACPACAARMAVTALAVAATGAVTVYLGRIVARAIGLFRPRSRA